MGIVAIQRRNKRHENPEPHKKACKRYEGTKKGRNTRRRRYFIKNLSNKFKINVRREMRNGSEFRTALKSVKRLIYTDLTALDVEAEMANQIVDKEYNRILNNYENRVIGNA